MSDNMKYSRQEYWDDVMSIRDEAVREYHESKGERPLDDIVHEMVDSSQWVIYTYRNRLLLTYTDYPDAATEELGSAVITGDGALNWAVLAYWAMYHDVLARIPSYVVLDDENA